ncbi:MAG TPA: hypothetical protein PLY94_02300 [Gemmatimonadaceae bacterium]|nr:hypothetical protein [Gemmatimonadaceae bacterium]
MTADARRSRQRRLPAIHAAKALLRAAALAVALALPTTLAAQRGEITLLGGAVQSPDVEFDRVTSTIGGPSNYSRERGARSSGAAVGAAVTFAIRGHVFAELGITHHGIERSISRTGTGDPDGPFLVTNRYDGRVTAFWMGPAYRFVDRERLAVSALAAPTLLLLGGDAYDNQQVFDNAPSRNASLGVMLGLRARYWIGERLGAQLSVEDVMWTFPLSPHPSDGTPMYPDTYRKTPLQHDLRVMLGVTFRMF